METLDLGLVLFENSPTEVARAPRHIAHAAGDELFICRQLSGRLALEQNGRDRSVLMEAVGESDVACRSTCRSTCLT
jgi:hypothetical protein